MHFPNVNNKEMTLGELYSFLAEWKKNILNLALLNDKSLLNQQTPSHPAL